MHCICAVKALEFVFICSRRKKENFADKWGGFLLVCLPYCRLTIAVMVCPWLSEQLIYISSFSTFLALVEWHKRYLSNSLFSGESASYFFSAVRYTKFWPFMLISPSTKTFMLTSPSAKTLNIHFLFTEEYFRYMVSSI